jgi:Tfp pilus assembly protein PilO
MNVPIKNRQQLLAAVAIAVVVLFAGDKLLFSPLVQKWKDRRLAVAELRKQITQAGLLLQREEGIRRRWNEMRINTLPSDTSLAEQQLLRAFDQWAQESRISVTSIAPQWKRDSDDYMLLECHVDAFGNLGAVSRFIYNIDRDPMALRLENVEISSRDNEGQQITLGLQISGLVLNPQSR